MRRAARAHIIDERALRLAKRAERIKGDQRGKMSLN
jgi:hypothetical protein